MVARTKIADRSLWVVLFDDREVAIDQGHAATPAEAVKVAIVMLARREALLAGTTLRVQADSPA